MEHLDPLDSAFWALDNEHAALHIGSVAVFEGPALSRTEFRRLYASKLHLVPRLRQRLRAVPLHLGRPAWVDDRDFDLDYHLRRTAVPAPGELRQLDDLVGRLAATHLDPDRPLWEAWLVEALRDGRWAIVTKMHHSMVDGMSGLAMLGTIFDRTPDAHLPRPDHWVPAPAPSALGLTRSALRSQAHAVRDTAVGVVRAGAHPVATLQQTRSIVSGLSAFRTGLRSAPNSSLSGELHGPRSYRAGSIPLSSVEAAREQVGGTINDVVLAMMTGALRTLILSRGERPELHQVHCLVPVSVWRGNRPDRLGNRVSALIVDLPVEFGDPLVRYRALGARIRRLKRSHESNVGEALTTALGAIPEPMLGLGMRAASRFPQHFLTTVVTNVPGPSAVLYAMGRPMVDHFPYVPIADRLRIGVAVTSYRDQLSYGITADRDSVRDVDTMQAAFEEELRLLAARQGAEGVR